MKKTLAAVLAAAMALSTATVAFADDFDMGEELIDLRNWSSSDNVRGTFPYGKDFTRLINSVEVEDIGTINGYDLAEWVDQGLVNVSVIVTEGSAKLAGKPSIEIRKVNNTYQTSETAYTWNCTIRDYKNKVIVRKGSSVGDIPVFDANGTWGFVSDYGTFGGNMTITADSDGDPIYTINDDVIELMKKSKDNTNNRNYAGMLAQILAGGAVSENSNLKDESVKLGNLLRMKLKVADTYGVDDTTVGMKLRITVRKSFTDDNGINHIKGNTYTSDEFKYKAVYYELSNYYEDMQLTLEEVDKRYVKLDASDLYDQIGADDFSISFEDTARFDAKLSASQKDVNLFYDVDEVTAVTDAYPSVDFEFITFRGKPSFINSGTMTFNAVGGKNTQVYTYDGDALTPLDGSYSSTYDTVTVKGIKKLGTFVVASEILEVEEEPEEPAEPVDSAPSVEDNDKNDDEGGNPNTGAC